MGHWYIKKKYFYDEKLFNEIAKEGRKSSFLESLRDQNMREGLSEKQVSALRNIADSLGISVDKFYIRAKSY